LTVLSAVWFPSANVGPRYKPDDKYSTWMAKRKLRDRTEELPMANERMLHARGLLERRHGFDVCGGMGLDLAIRHDGSLRGLTPG
jgi:hypothetical protein